MQPDLSGVQAQFGFPEGAWETRDYQPLLDRIREDSVWRFRVVCNPTQSVCVQTGQRGKAKAITVAPRQREWLVRQGERHGFALRTDQFDVVGSEWRKFSKGNDNGREVVLLKATFEGLLTVTDAPAFVKTLTEGLGRGEGLWHGNDDGDARCVTCRG